VITVEDILTEVEADVSALNGEIVRRAFLGHCCDFVDNQEEFARILHHYVNHRLAIHRLRVMENRWFDNHIDRLATNHYAKLRDHTEWAIILRKQLKTLWPCAACVWLYNPTHRIRKFPSLIC